MIFGELFESLEAEEAILLLGEEEEAVFAGEEGLLAETTFIESPFEMSVRESLENIEDSDLKGVLRSALNSRTVVGNAALEGSLEREKVLKEWADAYEDKEWMTEYEEYETEKYRNLMREYEKTNAKLFEPDEVKEVPSKKFGRKPKRLKEIDAEEKRKYKPDRMKNVKNILKNAKGKLFGPKKLAGEIKWKTVDFGMVEREELSFVDRTELESFNKEVIERQAISDTFTKPVRDMVDAHYFKSYSSMSRYEFYNSLVSMERSNLLTNTVLEVEQIDAELDLLEERYVKWYEGEEGGPVERWKQEVGRDKFPNLTEEQVGQLYSDTVEIAVPRAETEIMNKLRYQIRRVKKYMHGLANPTEEIEYVRINELTEAGRYVKDAVLLRLKGLELFPSADKLAGYLKETGITVADVEKLLQGTINNYLMSGLLHETDHSVDVFQKTVGNFHKVYDKYKDLKRLSTARFAKVGSQTPQIKNVDYVFFSTQVQFDNWQKALHKVLIATEKNMFALSKILRGPKTSSPKRKAQAVETVPKKKIKTVVTPAIVHASASKKSSNTAPVIPEAKKQPIERRPEKGLPVPNIEELEELIPTTEDLKRSWKQNWHPQGYRYMGPFTNNTVVHEYLPQPLNWLDEIARQHDLCYASATTQRECDRTMLLQVLMTSNAPTGYSWLSTGILFLKDIIANTIVPDRLLKRFFMEPILTEVSDDAIVSSKVGRIVESKTGRVIFEGDVGSILTDVAPHKASVRLLPPLQITVVPPPRTVYHSTLFGPKLNLWNDTPFVFHSRIIGREFSHVLYDRPGL